MLRKIIAITLAAVLLTASICVNGLFPESGIKAAAVSDTGTFDDLSQEEIVLDMGAGWNLGNQMEGNYNGTPGETAWCNTKVTAALMQAVADAGFKTVRIPCSYLSYIGSAPDYTINEAWLTRIGEVVDYAIDAGLYVIINVHGDGYHTITGGWLLIDDDDQDTVRAKYKKLWEQIATKFKDYDEHLIFESMNEVFDGTYSNPPAESYDNLNTLNQIFVDTVRQTGGNNAKRWLLVPGWNTNIDYTVGNYGFEIPTDNYRDSSISGNRIMISVHYYDPWEFALREDTIVTQWGSIATDSSKVASWGGESYMKNQIKKLYSTFTSKGYPVIIGEYGTINKDNEKYRAHYAKMLCTYAKQYGCVPVLWDNAWNGNGSTAVNYGMAVIDRATGKVSHPDIVNAIMGVFDVPAEEVTLSSETLNLTELGVSASLTETVTPSYTNDTAKWTTSDESIVTVKDGVVTATGYGTATVTVTYGSVSAECVVTVCKPLELGGEELRIELGGTSAINPVINIDGASAEDIVWTSSDESIASVENGTVTALGTGTAVITATLGSFSTEITVNVVISCSGISLDITDHEMLPHESITVTASVTPENTTDEIVWTSSNEKIATVENGIITATGLGVAEITATAGNSSAVCTVSVIPPITLKAMGGSVRIVEPYGLRFGIQLLKDSAYNEYLDCIVSYGTLIIPKKNLGDNELTFDITNAMDVAAVNIYSEDDTQRTYTGVLVGIPKSAFYSDIVGRGYLKYLDAEGIERVIYTDEIVRSYYQVANSAYTRYGNISNRTDVEQAVYEKLEALLAEMA